MNSSAQSCAVIVAIFLIGGAAAAFAPATVPPALTDRIQAAASRVYQHVARDQWIESGNGISPADLAAYREGLRELDQRIRLDPNGNALGSMRVLYPFETISVNADVTATFPDAALEQITAHENEHRSGYGKVLELEQHDILIFHILGHPIDASRRELFKHLIVLRMEGERRAYQKEKQYALHLAKSLGFPDVPRYMRAQVYRMPPDAVVARAEFTGMASFFERHPDLNSPDTRADLVLEGIVMNARLMANLHEVYRMDVRQSLAPVSFEEWVRSWITTAKYYRLTGPHGPR